MKLLEQANGLAAVGWVNDDPSGAEIDGPEQSADSVHPGTRLGPYEVVSALGAGAMGEVYRARDPRLDREVAIKVLRDAGTASADEIKRFEQEARAAGLLVHPNIVTVHDFGRHGHTPYVVFELLEGETLRERLEAAALPTRKAVDFALQIASGLAAAHEKGIVHRDLKPENLFVTREGRVKILDFGLAKLAPPIPGRAAVTLAATAQGAVLGTVGYMSPEQVRGEGADPRSDIFALGAILYEMLAGRRAFTGRSAVETLNAILKEEPPSLATTGKSLPPALDRIVGHCLEKSPSERFQSVRDLAFQLAALSETSGLVEIPLGWRSPRTRRIFLIALACAVFAGAGFLGATLLEPAGGGAVAAAPTTSAPRISFRRLTFQRGEVTSARFEPGGAGILYSAAWNGAKLETYTTRPESPESRPLGLKDASLIAISAKGTMALGLGAGPRCSGCARMLGQAPLSGGAPRESLKEVADADWSPDGSALAVVQKAKGGRFRLEYPVGHVLYESRGWIGSPRVSPNGELVAFLDQRTAGDDRGTVAVVDRSGNKRTLTREFGSARGIAWSPGGKEIWFAAAEQGTARALHAVSLRGSYRLIARMPATLTLHDVSREGRVLLSVDNTRTGMMALGPGEKRARDVSWLDFSRMVDLSDDGKTILFDETGEGGGASYTVYLRSTDGTPAIRLGDGYASALSPDKAWAISIPLTGPRRLILLPTGAGEARPLATGGIEPRWAMWFPDGKRIFFYGRQAGHRSRFWVQEVAGGAPRAITPEGTAPVGVLSSDGKLLLGRGSDRKPYLYPVDGGPPRPFVGLEKSEMPIRWSADGRHVYAFRYPGLIPVRIYRIEVATGRRELWREIVPPDPAGFSALYRLMLSADGKSHAYSYQRTLSELYLVDGWK